MLTLLLFLDQELGITHQIDEKNMPDLEPKVSLGFSRHILSNSPTTGGRRDTIRTLTKCKPLCGISKRGNLESADLNEQPARHRVNYAGAEVDVRRFSCAPVHGC